MKTVTDFPHAITETMDMGIPLPDGTRLSARVWMPEDAGENPVPAVLEYLPYRKSDGTIQRDQPMHPYIAGHGYACLRVDRRGTGDSEGIFDDEYSPQELQDGVDIINWIAAQSWCSGRVGIQGISWGGFNGLQIAALAPEALKAVITIGSTTDRYADDIHYKGGLQLTENIGWSTTAMSWLSSPPDPQIVGDKWRELWLGRLEAMPFLGGIWQEHPNRDAYWKHGSVCEDYAAIKAPVLAFGGLHDGYRNTMAALVENLSAPVKGVAGPWNHKYPHISTIGPSIGYLQEALRWWDRWLKDIDTGVEDDPAYRAYVMDSMAPAAQLSQRPGRWVAEAEWPAASVTTRKLALGDGTLSDTAEPFQRHVIPALACGSACGEYFPFGFGPGELPDDQRPDDALSSCFDSAPLEDATDLLGAPVLSVTLSADQPAAQLIVRLCDVRPDGTSSLISLGLLNLRHRNGFEAMTDLVPGQSYDVTVPLDQCAYKLPAGHRIRVALSASYWPYAWPEARPFTLTVTSGSLALPAREPGKTDEYRFPEPEAARPRKTRLLHKGPDRKIRQTDIGAGTTTLIIEADHGQSEDLESGLITESRLEETWTIGKSDPTSAQVSMVWTRGLGRGDWKTKTRVTTDMWGDATHYHIRQNVTAFENDEQVFDKAYSANAPRY